MMKTIRYNAPLISNKVAINGELKQKWALRIAIKEITTARTCKKFIKEWLYFDNKEEGERIEKQLYDAYMVGNGWFKWDGVNLKEVEDEG